jgi:nitrite reductase/ring-hydroxylating ferredoxin subunit
LTPNPAAPPPGTRLCALADLADPGARGFLFRQGEALFMGFVTRRGEAAYGYIDRCPHAGMPMASFNDRYLTREGDLILCAAHGALFRLDDGVCVAGPCAGRALTAWPVKVEQGAVVVGEAAAGRSGAAG